jgi:hypothetical protein
VKHTHSKIHYNFGICFNEVYCNHCKFTCSVVVPKPITGADVPSVTAEDCGADYCPKCGKEIEVYYA